MHFTVIKKYNQFRTECISITEMQTEQIMIHTRPCVYSRMSLNQEQCTIPPIDIWLWDKHLQFSTLILFHFKASAVVSNISSLASGTVYVRNHCLSGNGLKKTLFPTLFSHMLWLRPCLIFKLAQERTERTFDIVSVYICYLIKDLYTVHLKTYKTGHSAWCLTFGTLSIILRRILLYFYCCV